MTSYIHSESNMDMVLHNGHLLDVNRVCMILLNQEMYLLLIRSHSLTGCLQELQSSSYAPVYNVLKSATSLKEASDVVLHKFESPADQSSAVEAKRASMGQNWYNKYAGAAGKGGFGVKFLRTLNKIMGGKGGINAVLNRYERWERFFCCRCT